MAFGIDRKFSSFGARRRNADRHRQRKRQFPNSRAQPIEIRSTRAATEGCNREACRGIKGEKGRAGPIGENGERGLDGRPGPEGPPGAAGFSGNQGPLGKLGPKGSRGRRGEVGVPGIETLKNVILELIL